MSKFATTINPEDWLDNWVTVRHDLGQDVLVAIWEQRGPDLHLVEADFMIKEMNEVVVHVAATPTEPMRVVVLA